MRKLITSTKVTTAAVTENFAMFADFRNPLTSLGDHVEWTNQFKTCIRSSKTHKIINEKLSRFKPFILIYSKIWPDIDECVKITGFDNPLICVISSVGEHSMTPWMIIHNIGHTYLSNHLHVRSDVIRLLGLDPIKFSIIPIQDKLVKSFAARNMTIPNIAEAIYELFTTWVWYGNTKSDYKEIAEYCDDAFGTIMQQSRGKAVWHQYRPPINASESDYSILKQFIY